MNYFLWALCAAFIWGSVPLLEKIGLNHVGPLVAMFYRCLGVLLGMLFFTTGIVSYKHIFSANYKAIILLVLSGFLASFLGQICFYNSLKSGDVSRVVIIVGAYPVISFLLGTLVMGESLNFVKGCGLLLVIIGIWFIKIG